MPAEQYRLKPEAFIAAKRKILIAVGPIFLAFTIPIFYSAFYNADGKPTDWKQLGIIGGVFAVLVIISIFRLLRKKKKIYDEFVLTIDSDRISGKDINGNNIDFAWIEVVQIVKKPDDSFILVAGANNNAIEIPRHIEDAEKLEVSLNQISPVLFNPSTFFFRNSKVIILAVFGVLLVFIYSMNKIIIGITGPVLEVIFLWLFVMLHKVKDANSQTVKIKWFFLVPIICILLKMFFVLTGRHLFH